MDREGEGELEAKVRSKRNLRRLQKEIKELTWLSKEYWYGFGIDKGYETRVYINRDGIRLYQSSTIEAEPLPPHSPLLCHFPFKR